MKLQLITIAVIIQVAWMGRGFAQESKQESLVISAGMTYLARKDLVYSPFVHTDRSFHSYGLAYQREKDFFQFVETGITYNTSQIGSSYEMEMGDHSHMVLPHEFLFFHLNYGIGKTLGKTSRAKSWLGAALKVDLQASFYNFTLSNMFGYYIGQSGGIWYKKRWIFDNKHEFSFQLELPLITWMARPPYLAEDDRFIENISSHKPVRIIMAFIEDGQFAFWDKLQRSDFSLTYQYPVSKKWGIGTVYRFSFIHASEPKSLLSYQQSLNFTGTLKF
ncbi:hypothetical protein [Negadavirga shengliensis]|uniref:DUF2490 domain-containing protein n=1 Tax=Negadavirga shengliensis TaxID=1389218 RepID=A0ABV9SX36_9BACT